MPALPAEISNIVSTACLSGELGGLEEVRVRGRDPGGAEVDGAPAEAADEVEAPRHLLPHLHRQTRRARVSPRSWDWQPGTTSERRAADS